MTVERLRAHLLAAQADLDPAQVDALLSRVQSDPEVLEVALQWTGKGTWPEQPKIEEWTPRTIGEFLPPSSVLSALLDLRADPHGAADTLGELYVEHHPHLDVSSTDPFHDGSPFDRDPDAG